MNILYIRFTFTVFVHGNGKSFLIHVNNIQQMLCRIVEHSKPKISTETKNRNWNYEIKSLFQKIQLEIFNVTECKRAYNDFELSCETPNRICETDDDRENWFFNAENV